MQSFQFTIKTHQKVKKGLEEKRGIAGINTRRKIRLQGSAITFETKKETIDFSQQMEIKARMSRQPMLLA